MHAAQNWSHGNLADFERNLQRNLMNLVTNRRQFLRKSCQFVRAMSSVSPSTPNRLIDERSPYLLQHAHNPVDWHAWGPSAFAIARSSNRPIFLSIGYSTCHWCHVMEHESFENREIAAIMNELFVNVKVDREERPDVDQVYMAFIQATSGRGGWPMSLFLTPDLQPITGGTYFPPQHFASILKKISEHWTSNNRDVVRQGAAILKALQNAAKPPSPSATPLDVSSVLRNCTACYTRTFDARWGGFGGAPKFPQPGNLEFLLAAFAEDGGESVKSMIVQTLRRMQQGGIHDHIDSGFHRYSTDQRWHVPHFEKMLYDNAQLAVVYADACTMLAEGGEERESFLLTLHDTLRYVHENLEHKSGGHFAAEDADSLPTRESSKKVEGAFCVWTYDEITSALGKKVYDLAIEGETETNEKVTVGDVFVHYYSMKKDGNVNPDNDPHGELKGQNVPIVYEYLATTAEDLDISLRCARAALKFGKSELMSIRRRRPPPHLDTKLIAAWNGLAISALTRAACITNEATYAVRAVRCARFVEEHLMTTFDDGSVKLLRTAYANDRDDEEVRQITSPYSGYADDYAFTIAGFISLYQTTLNSEWLRMARSLQASFDTHFWSEEGKAYHSTDGKDDSVLLRMFDDSDGAEPASNSIAVRNLQQLALYFDAEPYRVKAAAILQTFADRLTKHGHVLPSMAKATILGDRQRLVVIYGNSNHSQFHDFLRTYHSTHAPHCSLVGVSILPHSPHSDILTLQYDNSSLGTNALAKAVKVYDCEIYTDKLASVLQSAPTIDEGGETVVIICDASYKLLSCVRSCQELAQALKM